MNCGVAGNGSAIATTGTSLAKELQSDLRHLLEEHLRMHHDVAQVSASIKLNDDYEGGELHFPRQGVTNRTLGIGEVVSWPSLVTHPHETLPLRTGTKYALTIWFELPAQLD